MRKYIAMDGEYEGYHTFTVKNTLEEAKSFLEEEAAVFPGVSFVAVYCLDTDNNTMVHCIGGEFNYNNGIDWESTDV